MGVMGRIAGSLTGSIGNVAFGAFDYASGKAEGEDDIRALAGATGNTVGGWAGGAGGAAAGAALGTMLLPGIGTAIGGVIGGLAGGIGGSTAGGWAGDRADELVRGNGGKTGVPDPSQLAAYGQGVAGGMRAGQAEAIARNYFVNRR